MMHCPHCNNELAGKECAECGETVPAESRYCMECGTAFEEKSEVQSGGDSDIDFEDRILCSDGTCTGIIIDGKCSECGKPTAE